ncbi:hypothetical protein AAHH67_15790 [Niallia circulans]
MQEKDISKMWGKSISVSLTERLTQLENENKLLRAALVEIAKETDTPYADAAQKALDEVKK